MRGQTSSARTRGLVAVLFSLAILIALGVLAGASWSATGSASSEYQYGHKVTLCHHTHSKKHPFVTITVDQHAVKSHLAHGDTLGACAQTSKKASKKHTSKHDGSTSSSQDGNSSKDGHQSSGHGNGNGNGHGNGGGGDGKSHGKGH